MPARRPIDLAAAGGVIGPVSFASAWSILGARAANYSPVHDAISQLAAVDSPDRAAMTAGIVAFGIGVPVYGIALRARVPGPAWILATASGIGALGVALFPLDSSAGDDLHGVFAAFAYTTLAAIPLAAARPLARQGHRNRARLSIGAGALCGGLLAATALGRAPGLFQRAGLTVGHAWIVASAVEMIRGIRAVHWSVSRDGP